MAENGKIVLMVGPSGSGKSTYVKTHFSGALILNADRIRKKLTGDESDQTRNREVFAKVRADASRALRNGRLVVVDNTNVQWIAREELYRIARIFRAPVEARVMATPLDECLRRNRERDRKVPEDVIRYQFANHLTTLTQLPQEGLTNIEIVSN